MVVVAAERIIQTRQQKGEIIISALVILEDDALPVEVRLEGETLWLAQRQMGDLFGTTPENVLMHLRNVFRDAELVETATTKDFLAVRQEGKRQFKHYNPDAIISVGYRVNSARATRFRQWATRVLCEQLTQVQHQRAPTGLAWLDRAGTGHGGCWRKRWNTRSWPPISSYVAPYVY